MRYHVVTGLALRDELAAATRPFVLDIRSRTEFEAGHVPGSAHLPVHEMGNRRAELPSSIVRRIIVVGNPGKRTQAGATWLTLIGYGDIAVLEGGVDAWPGELRKGPPEGRSSNAGPELRVVPNEPPGDDAGGDQSAGAPALGTDPA